MSEHRTTFINTSNHIEGEGELIYVDDKQHYISKDDVDIVAI